MAAEGAREGLVLLAEKQSGGKGRMGRSFYSPPGSGLYMSVLLRPGKDAAQSTGITACAAVAVALAIEELSGKPAGIKWVMISSQRSLTLHEEYQEEARRLLHTES